MFVFGKNILILTNLPGKMRFVKLVCRCLTKSIEWGENVLAFYGQMAASKRAYAKAYVTAPTATNNPQRFFSEKSVVFIQAIK
jgi:hypothetical protein